MDIFGVCREIGTGMVRTLGTRESVLIMGIQPTKSCIASETTHSLIVQHQPDAKVVKRIIFSESELTERTSRRVELFTNPVCIEQKPFFAELAFPIWAFLISGVAIIVIG